MEKGLSIDDCIEKAKEYIDTNGTCLFLFDVKGSKKLDPHEMFYTLRTMMADLNDKFAPYLPENDLAVYDRKETGFVFLLGDASWAGINSADVIRPIVEYQQKHYPGLPLYWGVARDGYDREGTKIAK